MARTQSPDMAALQARILKKKSNDKGEWRPEKNGTFGTFKVTRHISDPVELGEVEAQCSVPLVPLRIPEWALDMEIDPTVLKKIFDAQNEEAA